MRSFRTTSAWKGEPFRNVPDGPEGVKNAGVQRGGGEGGGGKGGAGEGAGDADRLRT